MPSRWPSTGTRASCCTRATSVLPPRGMIRSIAPSSPSSIMPTASRSAVGTICTHSAGRPASSSPAAIAPWIASALFSASDAGAQDHRIARAHADRRGVGGDVGPALVDHADHADRRAHPRDVEAVRPRPARHLRADRIGQVRDLLERVGDRREPRLIEHQPVDHAGRRRRRRSHWREAPSCRARAQLRAPSP